nr:uncharacterized protein LOC100175870 [Ciona intestinalis]|eukprot:XP_002121732.3 uncharacterized protein LOC100175870 [Ciona intestinalis]
MVFRGKSTPVSRQSAVLHPEIQSPFPRGAEISSKPLLVGEMHENIPSRPATMSHARPRASQLKSRSVLVKDSSHVQDLSAHAIPCSTNRQPRSAPAPTNMTFLPSAQEKLKSNRKLLAKVVGFDASVFQAQAQYQGVMSNPVAADHAASDEDLKISSARFNNAFSSRRSPRRLSSDNGPEMSRLEILRGQGLPATPRLLRGGNSKKYGVRREISSENQLELSPDVVHAGPDTKSRTRISSSGSGAPLHPMKLESLDKTVDETGSSIGSTPRPSIYHVTPLGDELTEIAVTNGLICRDRDRDVPWVYCYKVKRDRLKLSKLLSSKSVMDPAVDELLPAF